MPVPTSFSDLSTTVASNSPSGSETPGDGDNHLRTIYALLASIYGNSGNGWSSPYLTSGSPTITGNLTVNGNTTLGDASSDTLTINATPSFVADYVGKQKFAAKSATTSRNSTTSRTDDPHLTLSLTAGTWDFEIIAPVWNTTSTAGGLSLQMAYSGSSTDAYYVPLNSALTGLYTLFATSYNISSIMQTATGVNGAVPVRIVGSLTATSSGTLSLQWAQNSSSANAANIGIGASIRATRVI